MAVRIDCRHAGLLPVCLVMPAVVLGCGPSRPGVAPVRGQVRSAGAPVSCGTISFYPAGTRPATAEIGSDGRYTLTTFRLDDGAILGEHRVVIEAKRFAGPQSPVVIPADASDYVKAELELEARSRSGPVTWIVPERYASPATTPLRATVKPGSNVLDFDIP